MELNKLCNAVTATSAAIPERIVHYLQGRQRDGIKCSDWTDMPHSRRVSMMPSTKWQLCQPNFVPDPNLQGLKGGQTNLSCASLTAAE